MLLLTQLTKMNLPFGGHKNALVVVTLARAPILVARGLSVGGMPTRGATLASVKLPGEAVERDKNAAEA